jgi:hypothetical protein
MFLKENMVLHLKLFAKMSQTQHFKLFPFPNVGKLFSLVTDLKIIDFISGGPTLDLVKLLILILS